MKITGLGEKYNEAIELASKHLNLKCEKEIKFKKADCLHIFNQGESVVVKYSETCEIFRGLSFVERVVRENAEIKQTSRISKRGTMLDCCRNAVLSVPAVKDWIITTACMGCNYLYMYLEDIYEIEEYPYFGHKRGAYTKAEIKELDSFAKQFGLVLVPQIQTLGHLGVLKDWDCFSSMWDILDILLADEEETYKFIEAEIKSIRECFSSDIMHIGMDEAHLMGRGKYMDKHGHQETISLFLRHLNRVTEICKKYGFKPIVDSDLLFKFEYNEGYWSSKNKITDKMIENIPEEVVICYWDYYHHPDDIAITDNMMETHAATGREILYTCGAWNWWGFTPKNFYSNFVTPVQCETAIKHGIDNIKVSTFGDDGAECPPFAVLPAILRTIEQFYGNDEIKEVEKRSLEVLGVEYNEFMKLDVLSILGTEEDYCDICPAVLEKSAFYNDIMLGLMNYEIKQYNLTEKYINDLKILNEARGGKYEYLFETQRKLAAFLIIKAELSINLKKAYKYKNLISLANICDNVIPSAISALEEFEKVYNEQWHKINKPFGYDVQQLRIGGQILRLKGSQQRIKDYLEGRIDRLEELEGEDLPFRSKSTSKKMQVANWKHAFTRSVISHI